MNSQWKWDTWFHLLVATYSYWGNLHACVHRRLQSCVGTLARVGYAAFDAQLQKAYFVITLYTFRTSVHAYAMCWWHMSLHPVLVIWVHMIWNNLGKACRHLCMCVIQHVVMLSPLLWEYHSSNYIFDCSAVSSSQFSHCWSSGEFPVWSSHKHRFRLL